VTTFAVGLACPRDLVFDPTGALFLSSHPEETLADVSSHVWSALKGPFLKPRPKAWGLTHSEDLGPERAVRQMASPAM
jgi:hypothetical protein